MMSLKQTLKNYDVIGMSAAFLCMVHCVVFPLLIFIPIGISHNPYIDLGFLFIGMWSVYKTTKKSHLLLAKCILWGSLGLISFSVAYDLLYHWHSPAIYIGAFGLIIGHILNFNGHKKCHK